MTGCLDSQILNKNTKQLKENEVICFVFFEDNIILRKVLLYFFRQKYLLFKTCETSSTNLIDAKTLQSEVFIQGKICYATTKKIVVWVPQSFWSESKFANFSKQRTRKFHYHKKLPDFLQVFEKQDSVHQIDLSKFESEEFATKFLYRPFTTP